MERFYFKKKIMIKHKILENFLDVDEGGLLNSLI